MNWVMVISQKVKRKVETRQKSEKRQVVQGQRTSVTQSLDTCFAHNVTILSEIALLIPIAMLLQPVIAMSDMYGFVKNCADLYEFLGIFTNLFEHLRIQTDLYGFVRYCTDLYEFFLVNYSNFSVLCGFVRI